MLRPPLPFFLTLLLLLPACRDSKVESYRIAKESEIPPSDPHAGTATGGDMSSTPVALAAGNELTWTAPAHWQSKAASSMRKATYVFSGTGDTVAELAITAFPGDVGGDLANVNRWRGQLQLAPITEAELPAALTRSEPNGLKIAVADLAGPASDKPLRMLGAIVPFEGSTWFFKLNGAESIVAREKPAFLEFLKTIRVSSPAAATTASTSTTPAPAAKPDMANTPVAKADGPGLNWAAPADWQSKPASAMRKATYLVPSATGAATELAITAFPGDVGGELGNVNRWRGQLKLAPLAESELAAAVTRLSHDNLNFSIVDFSNGQATNPQRMIGAMVPFSGATWFFKLTGPAATVAAQKPAFLSFLQTVKAP